MIKCIFYGFILFILTIFSTSYAQFEVNVEPNTVNNSYSNFLSFNISYLGVNISYFSLYFPEGFSLTTFNIERGDCYRQEPLKIFCSDISLNEENQTVVLNVLVNVNTENPGNYAFVFESDNYTKTVNVNVIDVTNPSIISITPVNNTKFVYLPLRNYSINIKVEDDSKIDCIEFYFLENFTQAKCFGSKSVNTSFYIIDLPAGSYSFYFIVNDTSNNRINSSVYFFEIEKAHNPINVYINEVKNGNVTIVNGSIAKIIIESKGEICGYINNEQLFSCKEDIVNTSYYFDGVGYYSLFVNSSGNQNYTSNSSGIIYWIRVIYPRLSYTVIKAPSSETYSPEKSYEFKINFTSPSYPHNNITNVSFSIEGKTYYLPVSNPRSQVFSFTIRDLKAGEYPWTFCGLDTQGEMVCHSGTLEVNKAIPPLDIYNTGDYVAPVNKTIIAIGCPEQLICRFYLNNTKILDIYYDLITDKPGYYIFIYNTTGNENYTSYQVIKTVRVLAPLKNVSEPKEMENKTNETKIDEEKVLIETKNIYNLSSVFQNIINVENEDLLKVRQIIIEVKNNQNNVYIEIKTPSFLPTRTPPGNVFVFFEISHNISEDLVKNIKIRFKVDKFWIKNNDIDTSTISMYRWDGEKWEKLSTTKLTEDENNVYFEANSNKLSILAISGEKNKSGFPWYILLILIVVIVIGIILYLFLPVRNAGLEYEKLKNKWKDKLTGS
ncbi:MAG: PGF-pre-PGF domain-containing protein [Candidatus Aenigmatarchaeota archaeon]